MTLISMFSILKYGAKIFLAVMGFISFDDINVKPVGDRDQYNGTIECINYVESLPLGEQKKPGILCYADPLYFHLENRSTDHLFTTQDDYLIAESEHANIELENKKLNINKIYILKNNNIKDFEMLVINDSCNLEFEYCVQIGDQPQITKNSNLLKNTLYISLLNSSE